MMRTTVMLATTVVSLAGCATESADSLAAVAPALAIEQDVINCSDEEAEFYRSSSFYAAGAITEALGELENSPDNPVAERYFGVDYDRDKVRAILTEMADVAYNRGVTYSCEGEDASQCDDPNTLLWVLSGAPMTHDYTIHTCGNRLFTSSFVGDVDRGSTVSRIGAVVHELSHLAGAFIDSGYGEDFVLDTINSENAGLTPWIAESYRLYVMNINAE